MNGKKLSSPKSSTVGKRSNSILVIWEELDKETHESNATKGGLVRASKWEFI